MNIFLIVLTFFLAANRCCPKAEHTLMKALWCKSELLARWQRTDLISSKADRIQKGLLPLARQPELGSIQGCQAGTSFNTDGLVDEVIVSRTKTSYRPIETPPLAKHLLHLKPNPSVVLLDPKERKRETKWWWKDWRGERSNHRNFF